MTAATPSALLTDSDRTLLAKLALDHTSAQALPDIWESIAKRPDLTRQLALQDPHAKPEVKLTYGDLYEQICQLASGLQALGVAPGDRIALFADNSPRWMIADQGVMMAGAVDVVRSAQADLSELGFMLSDSGSTGLILEDAALLKKLRSQLNDLPIQFIVLLSGEATDEPESP